MNKFFPKFDFVFFVSKTKGSSSSKMFSVGNGILPYSLSSSLCLELDHTECGVEYADRLITCLLDAWFNMHLIIPGISCSVLLVWSNSGQIKLSDDEYYLEHHCLGLVYNSW